MLRYKTETRPGLVALYEEMEQVTVFTSTYSTNRLYRVTTLEPARG